MGFPVNLAGLWRPKLPGKSICSGAFNLPAALVLDPARGHKFVIRAHDKKGNQNAPDYDLLLFAEEDSRSVQDSGGFEHFDEPQHLVSGQGGALGEADEVPF